MRISDQMGVAIIAALATLLVRRLQVPARILPLAPLILSIFIVCAWSDCSRFGDALMQGGVSGLLASGIVYILLGLKQK